MSILLRLSQKTYDFFTHQISCFVIETVDDLSLSSQYLQRKVKDNYDHYEWIFPYVGLSALAIWYSVYLQIFVYWLTLGIVSSIGFGTGLHTGLLYLFPYVISHRDDYLSNIMVGIVWGCGSACGEITPFLVAQGAASFNREKETTNGHVDIDDNCHGNEDTDEFQSLVRQNGISCLDGKYLQIVVDFVRKYGFWTILISASYPNMFFDVLGLICGYYGFAFWDFFLPTLIGKSLIKAPIQVTVVNFLALYYQEYLDHLPLQLSEENGGFLAFFNVMIGVYLLRKLIAGLAEEELVYLSTL